MTLISVLSSLMLLVLVQSSPNNSPEMCNTQTNSSEEKTMKNTAVVGKNYAALLNQIGAEQTLSHEKAVSLLCAPHCKKIVNGAVWFEERDRFLPQLLSTGEKVGFWSIELLDVIPGKDDRTVVVRFLVHTEKSGVWNTMVILRCNDQLLITEINEVFNSYEGSRS
jgi:hypothetical protein